ncbi:EAL domain-containing protein [Gallaecimonas sp. GXIMD1310]|uniref:EAL domain-containing protein n=1 Tax=Gallaecimonas sp. GXIMD1310 TaxID=3131926 RepID=UPI0032513E20
MSCRQCHCEDTQSPFAITMAFQPIVDVSQQQTVAYEALVRGTDGTGAGQLLAQLTEQSRYAFDQQCRQVAITLAAQLNMASFLSINFMPNAIYEPSRCLATTLKAAKACGFARERIIFEVTEQEKLVDDGFLTHIIETYHRHGFKTAIDDFGAGYAGLNMLTCFQPDFIKLDRQLVSHIDTDPVRQAILEGVAVVAQRLGIRLIGEGVERRQESDFLLTKGVSWQQGYYFARPEVAQLPTVSWPA